VSIFRLKNKARKLCYLLHSAPKMGAISPCETLEDVQRAARCCVRTRPSLRGPSQTNRCTYGKHCVRAINRLERCIEGRGCSCGRDVELLTISRQPAHRWRRSCPPSALYPSTQEDSCQWRCRPQAAINGDDMDSGAMKTCGLSEPARTASCCHLHKGGKGHVMATGYKCTLLRARIL
jgi:hypothetical protein